jgi:RHS repeat-associated protein
LGSSSVLVTSSNGVVPGSTARYYPFGAYRTTPSQTITDRQFTGHQHNDDLGLIYMNARFYVPGIGRFASADTIVPDPTNPQQFNRYTYVLNNPMVYTDPTGHCVAQLPCPRIVEKGVDYVFGYNGCLNNPRDCADKVLQDVYYGVVGMAPLEVEDAQREHAYPDYVTVQGSILVFSGSVTMDTYSNVYGSVGLTVGAETALIYGASGRLSAGYIVAESYPRGYGPRPNQMLGYRPDIAPTEAELEGFNRGLSLGGGAGFGIGADVSASFDNSTKRLIGLEPGIYSPQASGGANYGFFLYDARDNGGKYFWELWFD